MRPPLLDSTDSRSAAGMPAEINSSVSMLWKQHHGNQPSDARTEIRGNVVTCELVVPGNEPIPGENGAATFATDAAAAVARITRQRVSALFSSRDGTTGVARETFTLEPSLSRGSEDLADRGAGAREYRLRLVDGRHADH